MAHVSLVIASGKTKIKIVKEKFRPVEKLAIFCPVRVIFSPSGKGNLKRAMGLYHLSVLLRKFDKKSKLPPT